MNQIADNIRRDISAAGMQWKQFQHVVAMICLLSDDAVVREAGRQWIAENMK